MINPAYLGRMGEIYAARYFMRRHWIVRSANYRTRFGEIDLVVSKGKTLAFVEVKTRSPQSIADPREAVDFQKQAKLIKSAMLYLQDPEFQKFQPRFDVIEVILDEEGYRNEKKAILNHYPNAFDAEGAYATF